MNAALAFGFSALVAVVLTPAVRALAHRLGAVDHALTSRKIHVRPVPRCGGIAIVAAFFVGLLAVLLFRDSAAALLLGRSNQVAGLVLGGLIVAGVGVLDDVRRLRARHKLLAQAAAAAIAYYLGFDISQIASPFGEPIPLGWLSLPFTVLWITGVVNALNLIDGLDGLAGGVALIAVGTTFVLAVHHDRALMVVVAAALAGSLVGFIRYNFNPASIFMGDSGSMFLGFVLATTAIQTHEKSSAAVAMLVPVVALGLPIGDTLLSMARRTLRGVPVFQADRGHIHHRLLSLGLSHRQAVLALYAVAVVLGSAAIAIATTRSAHVAAAVVVLLLGTAYLFLRRLGYLRLDGGAAVLQQRRRNLLIRARIRDVGDLLRGAASLETVWRLVKRAAKVLGADCVRLVAAAPDGEGGRRATELSLGFDEAGADLFRARYSLLGERPGDGILELGWADGRTHVDRDTEIAVEQLCEHVCGALDRIERLASPAPERKLVALLRRS